MIFVTADTHFYHKNIIRYCNRPYADMDDMIIKMRLDWNNTVTQNDIVVIAGDFAFAGITKIRELIDSLNGIKILVRGNHDQYNSKKYRENGFFAVERYLIIDDIFIGHYPVYGNMQEQIADLEKRDDWDKNIVNQSYNQYVQCIKNSKCTKILHGHIHDKKIIYDSCYAQYNIGMDNNNCKLITLNEAILKLNG